MSSKIISILVLVSILAFVLLGCFAGDESIHVTIDNPPTPNCDCK
jgi:hypothetical protein